jgi:hypothetical protein
MMEACKLEISLPPAKIMCGFEDSKPGYDFENVGNPWSLEKRARQTPR